MREMKRYIRSIERKRGGVRCMLGMRGEKDLNVQAWGNEETEGSNLLVFPVIKTLEMHVLQYIAGESYTNTNYG